MHWLFDMVSVILHSLCFLDIHKVFTLDSISSCVRLLIILENIGHQMYRVECIRYPNRATMDGACGGCSIADPVSVISQSGHSAGLILNSTSAQYYSCCIVQHFPVYTWEM